MKKLFFAFFFILINSVQAATFQGQSSGEFTNSVGPSGMVTTGEGTDKFTWGVGSPPSSLEYTGSSFNVDENDSFIIGSLGYFNGTINSGTGANSVDLTVMLNFTLPTGMIENFAYHLGLINTPNNSDPNSSADIVNFDNTVPSNFFSVAGVDFTLEFLGFGQLSGGGFTVEDSFRVLEGASAAVDLVGRITSNPGVGTDIPEPATFLLFGFGLAGIKLFGRRTI